MVYKIIFIDEERDQQNAFKKALASLKKEEKVCIEALFPAATIDEMIDIILSYHPDALVTDWRLNEKKHHLPEPYEVGYDGAQLVDEFIKRRAGFPCFITSSYEREASMSPNTQDINQLYSKELDLSNNGNKCSSISFQDKLILQIEKYRKRLCDAQKEFDELCEKRRTNVLNVLQEERLIELDSFLENALNKETAIPDEFKKRENSKHINTLIQSVHELLEFVKNEK